MTESLPKVEYPPYVDLRSGIDVVYNQEWTNGCGPHSVVNALDAMYDHAGTPRRHSRAWLWWWVRAHAGMAGANYGSTFASLKKSIETNGMFTEEEYPWSKLQTVPTVQVGSITGIEFAQTYIEDINSIKRMLCHGVPVTYWMKVYMSITDDVAGRKWTTHRLNSNSPYGGSHYVCIVGYDDVSERFLIENSWGSNWGDGGFFGIPYDQIFDPMFMDGGFNHIDRIWGFHPKPVEGFMTVPFYLTPQESGAFVNSTKEILKEKLTEAFAVRGVQGLVDECIKWSVSDKHLEMLVGWDRGTIRKFQEDNPTVKWTGFVFSNI